MTIKTNLKKSKENLILLIKEKYKTESIASRWGLEEYLEYEEKFLSHLSKEEQLEVFRLAYKDILPNEISKLFYLSSCFKVPLYKEYFQLLEDEDMDEKKEVLFKKIKENIDERWTESEKKGLSDKEKDILKFYSSKYREQ